MDTWCNQVNALFVKTFNPAHGKNTDNIYIF